ncbi:MAG: hypothetical protein IJV14_10745 [Lachnospiraceae bacterium]|nr:hypothetical protein [Lachnospiraceae bacterium]
MKPIKMTEDIRKSVLEDFAKQLMSAKLFDGNFKYERRFAYKKDKDGNENRLKISFTEAAYIKMLDLLKEFSSEVAWHATVVREDDQSFLITDCLVYPQEVTGATVNTDQERYQNWFMDLNDDIANCLHAQMHSHVNMGVTPSGVDLTHQESIVKMLGHDQFYIFMIWNKSLKHFVTVFDMKENVQYDTADVDVVVRGDDGEEYKSDIGYAIHKNEFIDEAKKLVVSKTYQQTSFTTGGSYGGTGYNGYGGNYGGRGASTGKGSGGTGKGTGKGGFPRVVNDWDDEIFGSGRMHS